MFRHSSQDLSWSINLPHGEDIFQPFLSENLGGKQKKIKRIKKKSEKKNGSWNETCKGKVNSFMDYKRKMDVDSSPKLNMIDEKTDQAELLHTACIKKGMRVYEILFFYLTKQLLTTNVLTTPSERMAILLP